MDILKQPLKDTKQEALNLLKSGIKLDKDSLTELKM
jgi:hypothetical protein